MKRIFILMTLTAVMISCSAYAFAGELEEARDAMIVYSGTNTFANLLPEERQACMYWVSAGGKMNETCRNAVHRLITEDPNAVTPSQRKALLAAASGTLRAQRTQRSPQPVPNQNPTVIEKDNTGAIIAAGVVGIIAGMIIHNNTSGSCHRHHHRGPPPPPRYRPVPYHHHRIPHPRY